MKKLLTIVIFFTIYPCVGQAMTLNELMVRSKMLLAQDTANSTVTWSNTELRYWINGAIRTISGLAECVERDTSITLTARQWEYTMPTDFIRVGTRGVFLFKKGATQAADRSPIGLIPRDGASFGKEATAGDNPKEFLDEGRSLRRVALSPTPSTTGDSMRVVFVSYGNTYTTDTSTVECNLPADLEEIVPMYVRYRAKKKVTDAGNYWQEFIQELQLIVPTLGPVREEEVPAAKP